MFEITPQMRKAEKNGKFKWRVRCSNCKSIQSAPRGPLPKIITGSFECDYCGKTYKSRHLIYQHMEIHRKSDDLECQVCKKKSKNRSVLRTHLRTHFENFICHLCGFISRKSNSFKNHMAAHEADPNQVLDYSKVNFEPMSRFDKKPTQEAAFSCRFCGYRFNTESAMSSHELRRHEGNMPIQEIKCKECGQIFHHMNDLRVHSYTHSNRPLIFCEHPGCGQFFNRRKTLNNHIRNVHKAKNVSCEICNKKFKLKGSLVKHLKNNRCIPVQVRKVQLGKTILLGLSKKALMNKTVDQLHEESIIAKEQFRALGGVLKDNPSRAKKPKKIFKKEEEVFSDISEESSSSESEDDVSKTENEEVKIKVESDIDKIPTSQIKIKQDSEEPIPMMKIEIKMEPLEDEEDDANFILQDHSIFVVDNYEHKSTDKNEQLDDDLNPKVMLEKLDYNTLLRWQKVKKESNYNYESTRKTSRPLRLFQDRYVEKYKKERRKREQPNLVCDECGENFYSKSLLKEHVYGHSHKYGKDSYCDLCGANFFFQRSLQIHKTEVHNKKMYTKVLPKRVPNDLPACFICDICGNEYSSYASITGHLKIVHKKIADFCCHICPAKFKTRVYLERHIEDVHEKIMRYQCKVCGKCFKRKYQVKEHENAHNDPVPCNVCGKMVRNLRTHIKNIHEVHRTVEKACCVECGKMVSIYSLQLHIDRKHKKLPIAGKSYPCEQCPEIFTRSDDLRR